MATGGFGWEKLGEGVAALDQRDGFGGGGDAGQQRQIRLRGGIEQARRVAGRNGETCAGTF